MARFSIHYGSQMFFEKFYFLFGMVGTIGHPCWYNKAINKRGTQNPEIKNLGWQPTAERNFYYD